MKWQPLVCSVLLSIPAVASAQATAPIDTPDPLIAIGALRGELIDSFNKGDVPRLLSHLDPDVVVTWQNGEVCRGPEAVRAYYDRMMSGPNRVVKSITSDPQVTDRHVYGDWAVSWGVMNDHFVLNDGSSFALDSRFTAAIARRGAEWKVTSFHASTNAFDNDVLHYAVRRTATWAILVSSAVAVVIGFFIGRLTKRSQATVP